MKIVNAREGIKQKGSLITFALFLLCVFVMLAPPPSWAQLTDAVTGKLNKTLEAIYDFNNNEFKKKHMKETFVTKIKLVQDMVEDEHCQGALMKLEHDILDKTDGCAGDNTSDKNDWLKMCNAQGQIYPLITDAVQLLTSWCESGSTFYEEYSRWNRPDPAITSLTVEPERAHPGDSVTLRATVSNKGTGDWKSAMLIFIIDNEVIDRAPVGLLESGAEMELTATWKAAVPGNHLIAAQLELGEDVIDFAFFNNSVTAVARVSGEVDPEPALEFGEIDFGSLLLTPGESAIIPIKVRNPSFAYIGDIPHFTSMVNLCAFLLVTQI